jgi:hypothetical protein
LLAHPVLIRGAGGPVRVVGHGGQEVDVLAHGVVTNGVSL